MTIMTMVLHHMAPLPHEILIINHNTTSAITFTAWGKGGGGTW